MSNRLGQFGKSASHISSTYTLLLILTICLPFSSSLNSKKEYIISSSGIIYPIPVVNVIVNFSEVIGINNLSLGVQIAHEWLNLVKYPELQDKFSICNFKIARFFIYHVQPCIYWNESTMSGIYDWTKFDSLMQIIQTLKVENILIVVGHNAPNGLPSGMERNYNNTGFPNPYSFAAYCKDIALHIKSKGWNVKYWEPYNEPYQIFTDWTRGQMYEEKYKAFVELFNKASDAIMQIFPDALCGVDISNIKTFLNRFVYDGQNVGFLSFHKYDAWATLIDYPGAYLSNEEVLKKASILGYYWDNPHRITPREMREIWRSVRGVDLPVLCTETNLNTAWRKGTDPRIQEIVGAVWYTEELRAFILNDVQFSVYFHFASDDSPLWETEKLTRGWGFGMIKMTPPHTEWYPFLINYLLGTSLHTGSLIFNSYSSNLTAISTLAWRCNDLYNLLIIGKVNEKIRINISIKGVTFNQVTIHVLNEKCTLIQTFREKYIDSIQEDGYFIALFKFS